MQVPTRAMASLLNAVDPQALEALRQRFPDDQDLFDTTFTLGEESPGAATGGRQARISALQALVRETSSAAEPAITTIVETLTSRMRRARICRLAGAVIATIASAGAGIVTTATTGNPWAVSAMAVVGLFGSLSVLFAEHLEKPLVGGQRSLSELLADTLVAESGIADVRLRLLAEDVTEIDRLVAIATRVSEIAAKIRQICVFGGIPLATTSGRGRTNVPPVQGLR